MFQKKKKLKDLEDRSRRNTMQMVNSPAAAVGDEMRGYLQEKKMLPV